MSIRGEVWPFLLGYYSPESTSEEREALRLQKQREYADIQRKRWAPLLGVHSLRTHPHRAPLPHFSVGQHVGVS